MRKRDNGRAAVADDVREGICYWEFSAEPDADPSDPETWRSCNPALGDTITERVLAHQQRTMSPEGFARAHLCLWTASDERVIPAAVWDSVQRADARPHGILTFGLDVSADRKWASIAVADHDGAVELVEHREGMAGVAARVIELAKREDAEVVIDDRAPAASLVAELEAAEVTVRQYGTADMTKACGRFYDAVADGKVAIRQHSALKAAAEAARRRMVGDAVALGPTRFLG